MLRSIRQITHKSNALIALLGVSALTALLGTLSYQLVGWPTGRAWPSLIFVLAFALTAFLLTKKTSTPEIYVTEPRNKIFHLFNGALSILIVACFYYGATHPASGWIGSPWQAVSKKFIAALFIVIAATAYGIIQKKITARVLFCAFFLLISINSLMFPRGFGFDVFVHSATVRAWLTHGTITPITPLYNGFHALIATLAPTSTDILGLISWIVPLLGTLILTAIYIAARTTREDFHKTPYIFLAFFIIFSALFTTATPQALGHFMLFGLISELWLSTPRRDTHRWILRILIALGIATIHPLSGIPALAAVIWMMIDLAPTHKKFLYILVSVATILSPATILLIGAHGTLHYFPPSTLRELFLPSIAAFQPFVLTRLAYIVTIAAPALLFAAALVGYVTRNEREHQEQNLFHLSLLIFLGALLTRAVHIDNIIAYEQSAFASRLLIAAYILTIPLAAAGFTRILTRSHAHIERKIIGAICVVCVAATWFVAYPAWNTVSRTKAINTSAEDFEIARAIDARAQGVPYIVLADQPTSAAALATFGFFDRQLPRHDFYFYPIPTGGALYTEFFLPAMYRGVTEKLLTDAATFAAVRDVFIVLKPYWANFETNTTALPANTTDNFSVGGAHIGHLRVR